ncbi:MAG TPA: 4-hydroxy-3-methylbut-2-enyl diphosphate reductase, partial [Bacteroidetes bacterium]|nr:4-hydroxy-3-methylbut-2-enyl diphosphate reductase [Bacteroidota bacterium]
YAREGFTTVIHGKFHHEETQATCSHVTRFPNAHFLVVLDRREAEWVAEAIRGRMPGKELMARLGKHGSPGFDPEVHLQKIGLANQTTMLSSESLEIAEILRRAILDRYGEEEVNRRFLSFDTICSATQDRQDAVAELIREHRPDLMLVIGGFNSSNTAHLAEIAAREVPAYHIEDAGCLESRQIRHRDPFTGEIRHSQGWLPEAPVRIGLTSGASTPNSKLAEVVERLFALKGMKGELQRLMENASG